MTSHLFHFRFTDAEQYSLRPLSLLSPNAHRLVANWLIALSFSGGGADSLLRSAQCDASKLEDLL